MRWPWKTEKREQSSYTDTLVTLLVQQASGAVQSNPLATASLEAAAGVVARGFAAARIDGPAPYTAGLTPACMGLIGRSLIRDGEIALGIDVQDGMTMLWPAADFDIHGAFDPATWYYRLNLAGPSRYHTRAAVPAGGVVHCRYLTDPARPWRGIGPIESAALAGRLSAETVRALSDESSGPRGSVMPLPNTDGNDDTVTALKADLKTLKGSMALVESMKSGWQSGDDNRSAPKDWEQKRIGAEMPQSLVNLNEQASREILMACGLSTALFDAKAAAGSREAWRQALHAVISPLARLVEHELREKLHPDISLNLDALSASDIQGRARAFQSMVGGGMDVAKAAALSGLMVADDE